MQAVDLIGLMPFMATVCRKLTGTLEGLDLTGGLSFFGSSWGFTFHHEDSLPDPGQDSRAASSQISRGLVNVCVVVKF